VFWLNSRRSWKAAKAKLVNKLNQPIIINQYKGAVFTAPFFVESDPKKLLKYFTKTGTLCKCSPQFPSSACPPCPLVPFVCLVSFVFLSPCSLRLLVPFVCLVSFVCPFPVPPSPLKKPALEKHPEYVNLEGWLLIS
jgi:hypothetical protein